MEKRGSIFQVTCRGRAYWRASFNVDGRPVKRQSGDRAEVERWLEGMRAEHPCRAPRGSVVRPFEPRPRRRKGCIQVIPLAHGGESYQGIICVGGVRARFFSRDRAEVERWLADRVAENPTYPAPHGTGRAKAGAEPEPTTPPSPPHVPFQNPFAGARVSVTETPSLWMVTAETNPNTSLALMREFGRRPARVLVTDIVEGIPIVWVADDNGGEGFGSEAQARERMLAMRGNVDAGVGLSVRPFSRSYRNSENC